MSEKSRNPYNREKERIEESSLSEHNKELLVTYLRKRRGQVNCVRTATKRVAMMRKVAGWIGKDLDAVTEEDILELKENIMGEPLRESPALNIHEKQKMEKWKEAREYKLNTKVDYIRTIKHFYKSIGMGETIEPLLDINIRYKTEFGDTIEDEHVEKVVASIRDIRNKALIMVLHESGARKSEFLGIKRSDLFRTPHGYKVRLFGKTGERRVPLVRSTPYLNRWLEQHPLEEHTARVWISTDNKYWGKPLGTIGLYKVLDKSFEKAGLGHFDTNPQNFRRSRATINARFMTEMVLEMFMGWSRGTKQTIHYVKMSAKDVENALMAQYGIDDKKSKIASKESQKPRKCHVCGTENTYESRFCYNCGRPLDIESVMKAESDFETQMKQTVRFMQEVMADQREKRRFELFKERLDT